MQNETIAIDQREQLDPDIFPALLERGNLEEIQRYIDQCHYPHH